MLETNQTVPNTVIIILMGSMFSTNVLAYGSSSSSKKACAKPKFTQFTPEHLTAVKPQSEFSFFTSASTNPESIVVSVKKQPVDVVVSSINQGYSVVGTLPDALLSTYARINIKAKGINNCVGSDGWLLKIE